MAQIRTQSDLKSLCEVSKHIAEVAIPRLYESITLHVDDSLDLDNLTYKINLCSNDNIKFTKNIFLKAPLNNNLRKRCPHYHSGMLEMLGGVIDMDDEDKVCLQPDFLFCSTSNGAEELILGGLIHSTH